jgi:hypothetical protein
MLKKLCRVPFFPGALPLNAISFIAVRWLLAGKNVEAVAGFFCAGSKAAGNYPKADRAPAAGQQGIL